MPSTDTSRRAPAPVDPRPAVIERSDGHRIVGWRCSTCRYPMQIAAYRCPRCGGTMADEEFGPAGTVWASTVLRIAMPGRRTPYVIAWIDLADGPRIIAHVTGSGDDVPVGALVALSGTNDAGDLLVTVTT